MKLIIGDFETFYGDDYTLSNLTTEAYVRDSRFETIMLGYKVVEPEEILAAEFLNSNRASYVIGHDAVQAKLDELDIENNAFLAHHAHFDGLILSHHFHHKPKV